MTVTLGDSLGKVRNSTIGAMVAIGNWLCKLSLSKVR
jgi:hypothetical protein